MKQQASNPVWVRRVGKLLHLERPTQQKQNHSVEILLWENLCGPLKLTESQINTFKHYKIIHENVKNVEHKGK